MDKGWRNGTRDYGFKVPEGVFRWNIGKEFFPEVRPWHRLPKELQMPHPWKASLGGELEQPVLGEVSLPVAEAERRGAVRSLSSPNAPGILGQEPILQT